MGQIVGVVFPLFAIIGLGKLAVRFRFLDSAGATVLSRFAFLLPVPALLFAVMAEGPTADVFGPGGVYFAGCLLMYCLALCLARWLKEPSWPHSAAFALDATYSNLVFLGTPLVLALYGNEGLSVLVGLIVFTTALLPISSVLMEIGGPRKAFAAVTIKKISIDLLKNPAVYPIILGLLWRATGWPLPTPVHLFVDLFARAAAPMALFCIGASLPPPSWDVTKEALLATLLKLIVAPLVIGGLCFWAGFTDLALTVPVVAAALPTGAGAFLLARGTTAHGAASATTVVTTTALSLATLSLLLFWLSSIQ